MSEVFLSSTWVDLQEHRRAVIQALERMYVLGLFDVVASLPEVPNEWQELSPAPVSTEGLTELVVQAHQELINADKRNAPAFRTLITTLRASQNRKSTDGVTGHRR